MATKIYFIRHGQSLGNLNHTFLGHTDLDLSPLGYEQAMRTAQFLKNIHIDKVYSSDLLRAYNTCGEYLKICGKSAVISRDLREIFAGDWEGNSFDLLQTEYNESYNIWITDIGNARPDNGESVKELNKRVLNTVTKIAQENDYKTVAVFTHATFIRSIFNHAYGNSVDDMKHTPWATNASVSCLIYDGGKFEVINYSEDEFLVNIKSSFPANV